MRKLLSSIALFILCTGIVQAQTRSRSITVTSGTATLTEQFASDQALRNEYQGKNTQLFTLSIDWTTSPTSPAGTVLAILPTYNGQILRVITNPTNTPTDNYDITLTDADGVDVLDGKGANRDTTNSESFCPLAGDGTTTNQQWAINNALTLTITDAGTNKSGVIRLIIKP